ncbi:MAG: 1-acyl-sn-glycerol-3-phosphate acyltransferase [Acidobacteriota bacterium]
MGFLERAIPNQSDAYRRLVVRAYAEIGALVLGPALPYLLRAVFAQVRGRREERIERCLEGAVYWGNRVRRFTRTRVVQLGAVECPAAGHLILINHVNELDFAFDGLVLRKPYLANQTIKRTLFAYWWMLGMGSAVFDQGHSRTIARSVRALLAGLPKRSYVVYPEGGNSYGEEIRPLRKGMLKLAFENRIPVFVVLKSGLASFQERQRDNVIGYLPLGTLQPADFPDWQAFREAIHTRMAVEKPGLDAKVLELRERG